MRIVFKAVGSSHNTILSLKITGLIETFLVARLVALDSEFRFLVVKAMLVEVASTGFILGIGSSSTERVLVIVNNSAQIIPLVLPLNHGDIDGLEEFV